MIEVNSFADRELYRESKIFQGDPSHYPHENLDSEVGYDCKDNFIVVI